MELEIRSKIAMVAAASKGIGLAIAKELAQEGCQISICGRNQETLNNALNELPTGTHAFQCDVTKLEELKKWVKAVETKLGTPDILITNNGGPSAGKFDTITPEQWQKGFETVILSANELVKMVIPGMKQKKWGRILHITSLAAKEPIPILAISSTLRAGMMALTRLQAAELAPYGITVNSILPGHTLTERQEELLEITARERGISLEEALKIQAENIPVKRLAEPKEIGAVATFLCSEQASYLTGVSLPVDGGTLKSL